MTETWRDRLAVGIEKSGKSLREISIASGSSPGYVSALFKDGKEPTVDKLLKVCAAANVSFYYVVGGFDITPETEEFLRLLGRAPERVRESVLTLLQVRRSGGEGSRRRA
jgi:transcriptional regulator with XRE-family HTH domain